MTYQELIVSNVRAEVARRNLTQKELAPIIGISRQSLNHRMNCKVNFKPEELKTIADYLDIDPTTFYRASSTVQGAA